MQTPGHEPPTTGRALQPLGDPDEDIPDFAGEHERFVVEESDDADGGESESPDRYAGGLDRE
jgi:hypothetical protein